MVGGGTLAGIAGLAGMFLPRYRRIAPTLGMYGAGAAARNTDAWQNTLAYGLLGTAPGNALLLGAGTGTGIAASHLPYEQTLPLLQSLYDPSVSPSQMIADYRDKLSPENTRHIFAMLRGSQNTRADAKNHANPRLLREALHLGSAVGGLLHRGLSIPTYASMAIDGSRTVNDMVRSARFFYDPRQVSLDRYNPHGGLAGVVSGYTAPIATNAATEYVSGLTGTAYTDYQRDWEKQRGINYDTGRFTWADPSPRLTRGENDPRAIRTVKKTEEQRRTESLAKQEAMKYQRRQQALKTMATQNHASLLRLQNNPYAQAIQQNTLSNH